MILQGHDHAYRLDTLGVNARCRIEERTGRPFPVVLRELAGRRRPPVETVLHFVSALVLDPEDPAPETARAILADIGGVPAIRKAAQGAWRAYRASRRTVTL